MQSVRCPFAGAGRMLAVSALAAALAACGSGGGSKSSPSAQTYVPAFTPSVAIDANLGGVNPPSVPALAAPATFANSSLARQLIDTDAAGSLGAGLIGTGVTIGLLDTGVDHTHPALAGRVKTPEFVNVDSSANDTSVDDVIRHGTTVAMLAAGKSISASYIDGDENVVGTGTWGGGVAPGASIVSSRIIDDNPPADDGSGQGNEIGAGQGYGSYFQQLDAQLANAGAKIINNSWGGLYWTDPALTDELASAWRDYVINRGGLIVFATGNDGAANPSDNAMLPSMKGSNGATPGADLEKGWLAVTAVDPNDTGKLDSYTDSSGTTVVYPNACGAAMDYCLAAPGTVVYPDYTQDAKKILALWQGNGTSFAAPQVSGAAAVVWAAFPYFDNDLVRQTLLGTATDIGDPGVDAVFGWGLLDVSKAANGPANFAWGDVSVNVPAGTDSTWRNAIVGAGGLNKSGAGNLTLAASADYTGATNVLAGGLSIRSGLSASALAVSSGATVWASGNFGSSVGNGGKFFVDADNATSIAGNYTQAASGTLGVWLGNALSVTGNATLAGELAILGVKNGYTTSSKETLLSAAGGVSGTFANLAAAPSVFLDASLGYDANDVFLDINRIDVTHAVAASGVTASTTLASAARVESAFESIDAQLAGGGSDIGASFIDGAGKLEAASSTAQALASLQSLSGELHARSDAMTFDNLDAGRRALSSRFGDLLARSKIAGAWSQQLGEPGQGALGNGAFSGNGWMMGEDVGIGFDRFAGLAFGRTETNGFLDGGRDRSRDTQTAAQFYTGAVRGNAYMLAQLGGGHYQRQLRRSLQLGDESQTVASEYGGQFFGANLETGYRFGGTRAALTPYAGLDYQRLQRDGFDEQGSAFGLRADASVAQRTQAVAGLRAQRAWGRWNLHGFAEWQQALLQDGLYIDASFVGADAWAPLVGEGFDKSAGLFGIGVDAALSRRASWSFGYDQRFASQFDDHQWTTKLKYGF